MNSIKDDAADSASTGEGAMRWVGENQDATNGETDASVEVGAPAGESEPALPAPWLSATGADLAERDFEAPIAGLASAAAFELSEAYRRAVPPAEAGAEPLDAPETRLFIMLSAIMDMHLKPHEREEPFGPMLAMADGRRSAIPADFRDGHIHLLEEMAMRAVNPVLRARLADICWLRDRRRAVLGGIAIAAYAETIERVESGALRFPFESGDGALEHGSRELLCRALQIGRTIGWDKPEALRARAAVVRLRERAVSIRSGVSPSSGSPSLIWTSACPIRPW